MLTLDLLARVTRFEFVKKRTLRRGPRPLPLHGVFGHIFHMQMTPLPPRDEVWTSFSHADDPAPSPGRSFDIFFTCRCTIVNDATSGGGKVLRVTRLDRKRTRLN